jgi:CheY-like chemotaxis protein
MTQPLVLCVFEKLMPCGQLANRLQDEDYRVQTCSDATTLVEHAEREKPLLIIIDLEPRGSQACAAITGLRAHDGTSHIPIIAVASNRNEAAQQAARNAGATLVVTDQAILRHVSELVGQALEIG